MFFFIIIKLVVLEKAVNWFVLRLFTRQLDLFQGERQFSLPDGTILNHIEVNRLSYLLQIFLDDLLYMRRFLSNSRLTIRLDLVK